ncbi:hypothetical protein PIB30_065573 [Stylosanthes scabra]|uniref:Uncharacterized protein n=1 Tax=Stylosanthes scabra TaxID=79078 RepID=A0ABU6TPF6_9FABA|nr:hypothetical protein [Stylosanthes scabra]
MAAATSPSTSYGTVVHETSNSSMSKGECSSMLKGKAKIREEDHNPSFGDGGGKSQRQMLTHTRSRMTPPSQPNNPVHLQLTAG